MLMGAARGIGKLSFRKSRLLNCRLDSCLMFSGRVALDLKVPLVLEGPAPVFVRVEREVLMFRGSKDGDLLTAKAANNSEI